MVRKRLPSSPFCPQLLEFHFTLQIDFEATPLLHTTLVNSELHVLVPLFINDPLSFMRVVCMNMVQGYLLVTASQENDSISSH